MTEDDVKLCERLKKRRESRSLSRFAGRPTTKLVNPDGPAAATRIEQLSRTREEIRAEAFDDGVEQAARIAEMHDHQGVIAQAIRPPAGNGLAGAIALLLMGTIREVLGNGSILGVPLFGPAFEPWVIFILPPGGFFTLGFILLAFGWWQDRKLDPLMVARKLWEDSTQQDQRPEALSDLPSKQDSD